MEIVARCERCGRGFLGLGKPASDGNVYDPYFPDGSARRMVWESGRWIDRETEEPMQACGRSGSPPHPCIVGRKEPAGLPMPQPHPDAKLDWNRTVIAGKVLQNDICVEADKRGYGCRVYRIDAGPQDGRWKWSGGGKNGTEATMVLAVMAAEKAHGEYVAKG